VGDVPACAAVLDAEGVDRGLLPGPAAITRVLASGVGVGLAFERVRGFGAGLPHGAMGHTAAPDATLVGFACTALLAPQAGDTARAAAAAGDVARVVRELEAGRGMLDARGAALHNAADGVALCLFGGRADALLSEADRDAVGRLHGRAMLDAHRGHQVRELLVLVASAAHRAAVERFPMRRHGPSDSGPPCLYGVTREDGSRVPGSLAYLFFDYRPPLLYCSAAQRDLLALALAGHSDAAIAAQRGLGVDAIKQRWRGLFAAAERRAPGLLPRAVADGRRGPEKRSLLLEYVREHPEELRPHARPS
jgi:hypothetical protein